MRKKSHLTLASYLMNSEGMHLLSSHKKALYLGSILPDCTPSFITRRHCMEDTFSIMKKELSLLIEHYDYTKGITSYFCRHLGIILHYIADYFTFAHNGFYPGNLREHCSYEEELKHRLRAFVKAKGAKRQRTQLPVDCSVDNLCRLIQNKHRQYTASLQHCVENDCQFITDICHQVTDHLLRLLEQNVCYKLAAVS